MGGLCTQNYLLSINNTLNNKGKHSQSWDQVLRFILQRTVEKGGNTVVQAKMHFENTRVCWASWFIEQRHVSTILKCDVCMYVFSLAQTLSTRHIDLIYNAPF